MAATTLLYVLLVDLTLAQVDAPSTQDFIRRSTHQATVLDNHLYLYGGEVSQLINGQPDPKNGSRPGRVVNSTLSLDLTVSWTDESPAFQQSKGSGSIFGKTAGIWQNLSSFFVFGGDRGWYPPAPEVPRPLLKYTSDGRGGGTWSEAPAANPNVYRQFIQTAMPAVTTCAGLGLYSGSFANNYTDFNWQGSSAGGVAGLIAYDFFTGLWDNSSMDPFTEKWAYGEMLCLPAFGTNGLVMFLGGASVGDLTTTDVAEVVPLPMTNITFYDPKSKNWYWQATSNSAPSGRLQMCAVTVRSENSSEIFFYGGSTGSNAALDELYVLTIPGFQWFKGPTASARVGNRCVVAGNRQMISTGGVGQTHWMDREGYMDRDPWPQGLGVFDMTRFEWTRGYNANAPSYTSPDIVKEWYKNGNLASVTWSSNASQTLFTRSVQVSPEEKDPPPGNSSSVIAGAVVGGITIVTVTTIIAWVMLRRWRQRRERGLLQNAAAPINDPCVKQELEDSQLPPHHIFSPIELTSESSRHELQVNKSYYELPARLGNDKAPSERILEL